MSSTPEISWFGALCDDDYEFLGAPDERLRSSWAHCRNLVLDAEEFGFDNILLPSGYELGIDSTAFASGVAPLTREIRLLLAVRMGELVPAQLARQLASVDQMANGRLTINIISSDLPGERLDSEPRYRRTLEYMHVLGELLSGRSVAFSGEFVQIELDSPRVAREGRGCPPFYFGGLSEAAKECAARGADVFLMWPDRLEAVAAVVAEMDERAAKHGRSLRYGWRSHVIVRETEEEARRAAGRLLSRLDPEEGRKIRERSLDSASAGVANQAALRDSAAEDGFAEANLWTGVGRARSGAGAAIVGDPDQVATKIRDLADVGVNAFILSGYPHATECDLFGRHVLPQLDHGRLEVDHQPVAI